MADSIQNEEALVEHVASRAPHAPGQIGIYRAVKAERGGYYLHVSLKRNGRLFQKYFIEKQYGGEAETMRVAQAWRDNIIALHPPMSKQQFCSIVRSNNTTGVAGVGRIFKRSRGKTKASNLMYWQARIPLPNGQLRVRNFSILRFGEEGAKALAIAARISALDDLENVAFRARRQPLAASTDADMAVLNMALQALDEKKRQRQDARVAKESQKADRAAKKLSHAVSTEQGALSSSTNRSGEPYIGRGKTPANRFYWTVSLIRQGTRHRKCFSDSIYGGADEALQAAKAWRDQIFATLPIASKAQVVSRVKSTNTSGVAGVTRMHVVRKGTRFHYWVAHSPMVKGQTKRTKAFSIEKHGDTEALSLARTAREKYVQELEGVAFLQHRAARQMLHIIEVSETRAASTDRCEILKLAK